MNPRLLGVVVTVVVICGGFIGAWANVQSDVERHEGTLAKIVDDYDKAMRETLLLRIELTRDRQRLIHIQSTLDEVRQDVRSLKEAK